MRSAMDRTDAQTAAAEEVEAPAERRRHRTALAGRIPASARPVGPRWRACLDWSKAVRSGCSIEVHLQEGLLMRRLATGRSCRVRRKDPWLCVPVSRRVCLVSDRIVRQPTWLFTAGLWGPRRSGPYGPKVPFGAPAHQMFTRCGRSARSIDAGCQAAGGLPLDDKSTISGVAARDQTIDARGWENNSSSSSAGSGRAR